MQYVNEVFCPIEDHPVDLRPVLPWEPRVPHENDGQEVVDARLLEQVEQFLAGAFLSPVIEAFNNVGLLILRLSLVVLALGYESPLRLAVPLSVSLVGSFADPVSDYLGLRLTVLLLQTDVSHHQVYVILL